MAEVLFEKQNVSVFSDLSNRLRYLIKALHVTYHAPPANIESAFNDLPVAQQNVVIGKLQFYVDLCEEALRSSWDALEDQKITFYAIRKLGLRPPELLFSQLATKDCIEIYDLNGVQAYRSFNFCNYCSYSLEELMIYPWTELYQRNDEVLKTMHIAAAKVLTVSRDSFEPEIPSHVGIELRSSKRREVAVEFKRVSPLFASSGDTAAFLVASHLKVLKEVQTIKEPATLQDSASL